MRFTSFLSTNAVSPTVPSASSTTRNTKLGSWLMPGLPQKSARPKWIGTKVSFISFPIVPHRLMFFFIELGKLKRFDLIAFAELADFHYSRKFWDCHRTTPVPPALTGWDRFFCDVLLPLDQQRCRGKLIWRPVTWQHKHNKDIKNEDVMSRLRVIAPTGFVLLTSLPREDRQ